VSPKGLIPDVKKRSFRWKPPEVIGKLLLQRTGSSLHS